MTGPESKTTSGNKVSLRASFTIFEEPIFYVCLLSNILFQYGFDAFMTTLVSSAARWLLEFLSHHSIGFTNFPLLVLKVDFAVDRGATLQQAVNLLPWFSVADFIGRSIFPFAADKGYIRRQKLIMICYLFCGRVFTQLG